ncbi:Guanine nucleotide-binding protein G(s) subunit alpha isoforms short [Apodemus speciosus]|uniref:Guanine nucleotide-binding protein G(S) subunit alpha isoforms short n=1 Tax=Apodemus speciosus TaxID=105296 RepID=A0ABQ0EJW0_APOSI
MLKMAMKLKARAAENERKTAAAAAEVAAEAAVAAAVLAEPFASQKNGVPAKPPKSVRVLVNAGRDAPPAKLLTDKERKKIEKKLLEQRRKEEKKREKERKKLEKMLKKKKKNVPEAPAQARGREGAAATAAGEDEGKARGTAGLGGGAATGGTSRAWARWDSDTDDEDDAYYAPPRVGGVVWRPGPAKAGALSAHMPLVVFLVFSVRSPSWVLNFLLQRRTEQGRGCGFVFGATCCFRVFLGCAFFSFLSGRAKRRGRGRSRARGTGRRGRDERLI